MDRVGSESGSALNAAGTMNTVAMPRTSCALVVREGVPPPLLHVLGMARQGEDEGRAELFLRSRRGGRYRMKAERMFASREDGGRERKV